MLGVHLKTTAIALLFALSFFISIPDSAAARQCGSPAQCANMGTIGIVSGNINGTYIRIATDLASVLDDGDNLRILPIAGKGSLQNIKDLLYLKGVDIGIVQSDVYSYVKRENIFPKIDRQIRYITKLYNEEVHLLARDDIVSAQDLVGRKVNFGLKGSGTNFTARIVFDVLNTSVVPVYLDQALALEKLKRGEIAAMVYVAGKPTRLFQDVGLRDGVHLVSITHSRELLRTYLPSWLTHNDYPLLVPRGQSVDTLAVGAVMAVYNWKPNSVRYRKVAHFVDEFFSRFSEFLVPPRHAKWQEVNLRAVVPGWTRFSYAESALK